MPVRNFCANIDTNLTYLRLKNSDLSALTGQVNITEFYSSEQSVTSVDWATIVLNADSKKVGGINNNNHNIYLLQLGCHPVAVVILLVNET